MKILGKSCGSAARENDKVKGWPSFVKANSSHGLTERRLDSINAR